MWHTSRYAMACGYPQDMTSFSRPHHCLLVPSSFTIIILVKMRGYSKTPRVDEETFLILDRLYGTLDDKIEMWESKHAVTKACCGGVSEKDPAMLQLLQERLLVAYDLSSAIKYLHDLRYVRVIGM
jgi:hypothetical protein